VDNSSSNEVALKVAAVARRTGVSVRTLHYYEEIGLLSPSGRTASGHRLYTRREIQRLQQIRSLQHLGMGLSEISECFEKGRIDAKGVVRDHLERVRKEMGALGRLESLLNNILTLLDGDEHDDGSTTETFLKTVETMTMLDKYFTQEQQKQLHDHQASGTETVTPVVQDLQKALDSGVPPGSPEARTLIQRWTEALEEVTGGDQAMVESIHRMLHEEEQARESHGISDALFAYMGQVMAGEEHA